jgi:hypothetical protein
MSSLSTPVFRTNVEDLSHQSSQLSDAIVLNTEIRNNPTHSVQQKQVWYTHVHCSSIYCLL